MSQKKFKKDGLLYDVRGAVVTNLHGEENKHFVVIAKCGHCGRGFYIPIMFSVYCKDIYTAVERVKEIPRVKKDHKGVIIDAFETSQNECNLINAIGDRDPFLRGFYDKETPEIQARRLVIDSRVEELYDENKDIPEEDLKRVIKTADTFDEEFVLQRYFAPIIQGDKVIYSRRYDRKQLMEDYLSQSVLKHGVRKGNSYFLSMYYQLYGKNNKLGLIFDNGWFIYEDKDGKLHSYSVDDIYYEKLVESGVFERDSQVEEIKEEFYTGKQTSVSAVDRFSRRMFKHNQLKNSKPKEKQPGEEE